MIESTAHSNLLSRPRLAAAAVAIAACFAVGHAASAWGATTVGQLFEPIDGCAANSIYVQTGVASGTGYTVPSDGVITQWSYQLGNAAITGLKLEVASPSSGGSRTIVGVAAAGSQTPGSVNTYPARIPVSAGDVIGIFFGGGGNCLLGEGLPGDNIDYDMADLAPGTSGTFSQLNGYKLPVQATLEPDADHDGYGDETQDQCPTDPSTQGPCPVPPPPPPAAAPKDTSPPVLSAFAAAARLSRSGSISFFIRSNEAASGTATGTVSLPKGARVVRFKKTKVNLPAGVRRRITLKLARGQAARVRAALKRHRLKAKVTVSVKDAAGNATIKRLALRLKR